MVLVLLFVLQHFSINLVFGDFSQFCIFLVNVSYLSNKLLIGDSRRYLCLGKLMNILNASLVNSWQHPWAQYRAVLSIIDTEKLTYATVTVLFCQTYFFPEYLIFLFIVLIDLGNTGLFLSSALRNVASLPFCFYLFWHHLPPSLLASHLMFLFMVKWLFSQASSGFVLLLFQGAL